MLAGPNDIVKLIEGLLEAIFHIVSKRLTLQRIGLCGILRSLVILFEISLSRGYRDCSTVRLVELAIRHRKKNASNHGSDGGSILVS